MFLALNHYNDILHMFFYITYDFHFILATEGTDSLVSSSYTSYTFR